MGEGEDEDEDEDKALGRGPDQVTLDERCRGGVCHRGLGRRWNSQARRIAAGCLIQRSCKMEAAQAGRAEAKTKTETQTAELARSSELKLNETSNPQRDSAAVFIGMPRTPGCRSETGWRACGIIGDGVYEKVENGQDEEKERKIN